MISDGNGPEDIQKEDNAAHQRLHIDKKQRYQGIAYREINCKEAEIRLPRENLM